MKQIIKRSLLVLFLILGLVGCGSNEPSSPTERDEESQEPTGQAGTFTVAVPMEMEMAMTSIIESYGQGEITILADKSGALQKTIEDGSDIDVFVSGDIKQMDTLVREGRIDESQVSNLVAQELVLIQDNKTSTEIQSVDEIPNVEGRIGVGDINIVPVGRVTQEALVNLNLWNKIQDKSSYLNGAETVIANVEQGDSDVGFVYRSDMYEVTGSRIVEAVNPDSYTPVIMPVGILKDQDQGDQAQAFVDFLQEEQAQNILNEYGFKSL